MALWNEAKFVTYPRLNQSCLDTLEPMFVFLFLLCRSSS
ncbi:hypothetical protein PHET_04375 [Paragonimus heterotremus]|uniref:Uncharacterized protein n=1 Tax=Paragonimus heterotremus TaxID=100268 RepID=A0A8J4SQG3_9TREM|nr:hypothetical protein PHET_04375 [Paragonimus heterotremus]